MIINSPSLSDLSFLKDLWKEAFGDENEFIDCFFELGFSPDRALCAYENEEPISTLYWFDCEMNGEKIAYVYGVATRKAFRGRGLSTALMNQLNKLLSERGYSAIVLVPAKKELFNFYARLGYIPCSGITEKEITASDKTIDICGVSVDEYFKERGKFLPKNSLILDKTGFAFLNALTKLYAGKDFVLAIAKEENKVFIKEFLGNDAKLSDAIRSLGYTSGYARLLGSDRYFAMYLPLSKNFSHAPTYLGFAFD